MWIVLQNFECISFVKEVNWFKKNSKSGTYGEKVKLIIVLSPFDAYTISNYGLHQRFGYLKRPQKFSFYDNKKLKNHYVLTVDYNSFFLQIIDLCKNKIIFSDLLSYVS